MASRIQVRCLWIGASQHLLTKVSPGEFGRVPFHLIVIDGSARSGKLAAHVHIKAIDDKHVVDLSTVEAATKFQQGHILLKFVPLGAKFGCADSHLGGGIHGIVDLPTFQSISPRQAEGLLECILCLRLHCQCVGFQFHSLRCDGAIVLVNELLFIDDLRRYLTLRNYCHAFALELQIHEVLHLFIHCVRLDEHKGCMLCAASPDLGLIHAPLQICHPRLQCTQIYRLCCNKATFFLPESQCKCCCSCGSAKDIAETSMLLAASCKCAYSLDCKSLLRCCRAAKAV
mmetsp:Transcript_123811/g.214654  ORF Transcript_123811/g.214654 Transcript_123811/m.214654 type:complete len:286 (+) Transcript_123811:490-1347(+)